MRHHRKYNLFACLSATALLLATACSDDAGLNTPYPGTDGKDIVTFVISPEIQNAGTRAALDEGASTPTKSFSISDGTHADALLFTVYEVTTATGDDGTETVTDRKVAEEFVKSMKLGTIKVGKGQNVISVTQYPCTLQFATDPDKKYQIAFWAQSSLTEAFDAQDLMKVEVKYDNAKNNDELRDAFCAVTGVFQGGRSTQSVTLRRPLAQINVGSAGWDYESTAHLEPNKLFYTTSKITLSGVAHFYNVLEGHALTQSELDIVLGQTEGTDGYQTATTDVTFDSHKLPALIHLDNEESFTVTPSAVEEYLTVKLYDDKTREDGGLNKHEFFRYIGWEDYNTFLDELEKKEPAEGDTESPEPEKQPKTEVFKYLSMAYVLVPEAHELTTVDSVANATFGSVLSNVTFEMSGGVLINPTNGTPAPENLEVFKISNVPVQKNWRTNILGYNFFLMEEKFNIYIVPDYCGDYNNVDEKWKNIEIEGNEEDGWTVRGGTPNDKFGKDKNNDDYYNKPNEGEPGSNQN